MPSAPRFTVVVPTQGRASLRHAVESVLHQTLDDFELLVVCDGDSALADGSLAGLPASRIRRLSQPASGVCAARNLGVSHAAGEWITFLDDDDTVRPEWLATFASGMEQGVEVVTANLAFHDDKGSRVVPSTLNLSDPTVGASRLLAAGFAVRRDLFDEVGRYDERLRYSENQDLGLRLCDRLAGFGPQAHRHLDVSVADIHVEPSASRTARHGKAQGEAVVLMLERHAARFERDTHAHALFLRILSHSLRTQRHHAAARRAALESLRLDWRASGTWKVAGAAVLAPILRHPRMALASVGNYLSRSRS